MPKTTLLKKLVAPIGTMQIFAGGTIAPGWMLCDGSTISRTTYAELYAALGDAHGNGDGSLTFHLPDMRGRFARGTDTTAGNDPDAGTRTAANIGGNTGDNVGSVQGHDAHSHEHFAFVNANSSNQLNLPTESATSLSQVGVEWGYQGASNAEPDVGFTSTTGGAETRPQNVNVNYIIRVE